MTLCRQCLYWYRFKIGFPTYNMFGVLFNYYCIIRFNDRVETRDLFSCAVNIIKIMTGPMGRFLTNLARQCTWNQVPGTRKRRVGTIMTHDEPCTGSRDICLILKIRINKTFVSYRQSRRYYVVIV